MKMNIRTLLPSILCLLLVTACAGTAKPETQAQDDEVAYPATEVRNVKDVLHGVELVDPYRWLEKDDDAEVQKWQQAQTALAREYLDTIPDREKVRQRIAALYKIDVEDAPLHRGNFYFQKKRRADEDQPVLWVSEGFPAEQRELVNPNTLGGDNTVALDWYYPSWDGRMLAYGLSSSGSERSTLYIKDVTTGKDIEDRIPNTRSAFVTWLPDNSGFYYTRRPAPDSGETWFNRVYFHSTGNRAEDDALVYGEGGSDDLVYAPVLSPDGKHLVILVFKGAGASRVDVYYRPEAQREAEFKPVAVDLDAAFYPDVKNDRMVVLTNYKAPRYRVIEIKYEAPEEENWKQTIPQSDDIIDEVLSVKGHMVVKFMHHASSRIFLYKEDGSGKKEISLPTLGTVSQLHGEHEDEEFFYKFKSFFHAGDVMRYSVADSRAELVSRVDVPVDPDSFEVKQVFYKSKDGTRVPMFIAMLRGMDTSAPKPVLLTGYGGFNVALTPYFLGRYLPFIEHGGIFAVPNMRGGSEYGEDWHRAGMLENKQNVFDDFISAAEYLVDQGMTTPDILTIRGGSNGGLLVGAAMTQRPDLFKAVVCAVPLLDMIRYHKFLIARLWIPEYGSSDDAEQFRYLLDYSPYHNVKEGTRYPATLILTAESDSRVHPFHARKMTALLQAKSTGSDPILLHIEEKAGHGKGKPVSKKIDETTDILAFAMYQARMLPVKNCFRP